MLHTSFNEFNIYCHVLNITFTFCSYSLEQFRMHANPLVLMVTVLNEFGMLERATDMLALGGTTGGFIFDHVPVRLLSTIQLLIGQIDIQYKDADCRLMLEDYAAKSYKWKLRRSSNSATKELRVGGLNKMIFLNSDLFLAIDYGVLYLLDHPYFVVKDRTPISGDHKFLYFHRMTVGTRENIPTIHFKRLPTDLNDQAADKRKNRKLEVSTGARWHI